ncbi:hypothetical protein [Clostridium sp.]|uniref:hypothetical protein n=1 Tax=Clostridium sp. TaxID=1506 RepID=UPI0032174306
MLDQRGLKSVRNFSVGMLLISIVINTLLVLRYFGYDVNIIQDLGYEISIIQEINIKNYVHFFFFIFVATAIGSALNRAEDISQDAREEIRLKMRLMQLGTAFFILYILFSALVIKDLYFIIAGFIMLGIYVNVIFITEKIIVLGLNDYQMKWRAAVNGTSYDVEGSSILWRFKLWFMPIEKVPFNKRSIGLYNIILMLIFGYSILESKKHDIFKIVFLIITIIEFFSLIEYILGLYTSLTGICTGITEASESEDRREYWTVYVTDFKNKREITYRTYCYPYVYRGEEVKVVHGIFSKQVILVNGRTIK